MGKDREEQDENKKTHLTDDGSEVVTYDNHTPADVNTDFNGTKPVPVTLSVTKGTPVLVLSNTDGGTFEANVVIDRGSNHWNRLINIHAVTNLHSAPQTNVVTHSQDQITKEYEISNVEALEEKEEKDGSFSEDHGDPTFVCDTVGCGRSFKTLGHLKYHQAVHSGHGVLECQFEGCGRKFAWPAHLKYHQLTHTGERMHRCDFERCGKRFYTAQRLMVHKRMHTGEKPYLCTYKGCTRAFTTYGNLKNHIRTHTGEKPYRCDEEGCTKSFAEQSSLKKHKLVHSGAKPFVCTICGRSFTQSGSRNVHMKRHQLDQEDGQKKAEQTENDSTTIVYKEKVLVVKTTDDEIMHLQEFTSSGSLVLTQAVEGPETSSSVQDHSDTISQLSHTTLTTQGLETDDGQVASEVELLTSSASANVVVLTQPQEIISMATGYEDSQPGSHTEVVYSNELLPSGLDHEEIAQNLSQPVTSMNTDCDTQGKLCQTDDKEAIIMVPMLDCDVERSSVLD